MVGKEVKGDFMTPEVRSRFIALTSYVFITNRKGRLNIAVRLHDRPKVEGLNFIERWLFERHCFKAYEYIGAMQQTAFTLSRNRRWVITYRAIAGGRLFIDIDAQPVSGGLAANDSDYAWVEDVHELCISIRFTDYAKYVGLPNVERRLLAEVIYSASKNRMPATAFPRPSGLIWKLKMDWSEHNRVKVQIDENRSARILTLVKKYGPAVIAVSAALFKVLVGSGYLG
jgi:hypothetical protein